MTPALWVGLLVCLVGIFFQVKVRDGQVGSSFGFSTVGRNGAGQEIKRVEMTVVKSEQKREVSERKIYFDFESLERGARGAKFMQRHPEIRDALLMRREFEEKIARFQAMGLAVRHPDVVAVSEGMKALREEVAGKWRAFQVRP